MSVKSVSTAISDLVLAGCSFYAAFNVFSVSRYTSSGFVSIALAASFGVLRFGVVFPSIQQKVIRMHALLTWIASVVGIPFIAAGCCVHHHKYANAKFHLLAYLGCNSKLCSHSAYQYLQEATAILISATWPQMYFCHYINTIGLIGELNVVPNSNLPGLIMLRYFVYCICIIIHSTLQITIYMSHFCLQIAGASRGGQRFKGTAVSYRLK